MDHSTSPDRSRHVILSSGGLDSSTVLGRVASEHPDDELFALSFRYGQRHDHEIECARRQARRFAVAEHRVVDLSHLASMVAPATALVSESALQVPKSASDGIPVTYVPARNTLFLSYALAWAEVLHARDIWIGVNAVDYSGYPDCRPEFIDAYERMANLATKAGVDAGSRGLGPAIRVRAPLIGSSKRDIIERGHEVGVDFADTISCYDPDTQSERVRACGACDSCRLRLAGFASAGLDDPADYVERT